jgi:small Trp-rich protein
MAFVIVGVLLLAMKLGSWGPVADWGWLWVLAPFGLAVAWWAFADATGWTQRRAMQKMEERKVERRRRQMQSLGLDAERDARVQAHRRGAAERGP